MADKYKEVPLEQIRIMTQQGNPPAAGRAAGRADTCTSTAEKSTSESRNRNRNRT
jgi:hypothetical protein